ncbi:hypothetical protein [Tuberibacillus sp. Marseille-P3662]|uniref:hypothetical protein n=1 Tax=Tuberibacillus sp. Marseille-P3662 TaxID=1965358 RepID=UPI000A1CDD92|nr:hypothetical protein [Tuberibacillus sp. Marseille-P3662]
MTEFLTTGQMVDRLKVLDVAKGISGIDGHIQYLTLRNDGVITDCDRDGNEYGESPELMILNRNMRNKRWRILPRYVSFEEAMKAIGEGKTVKFHESPSKEIIVDQYVCLGIFEEDGIAFRDLFDGQWTIEDK